jgi:pentatricopeptide repeat domain-containing protein 1
MATSKLSVVDAGAPVPQGVSDYVDAVFGHDTAQLFFEMFVGMIFAVLYYRYVRKGKKTGGPSIPRDSWVGARRTEKMPSRSPTSRQNGVAEVKARRSWSEAKEGQSCESSPCDALFDKCKVAMASLAKQGRWSEAAEVLTAAVNTDEEISKPCFAIGMEAFQKLGDWQRGFWMLDVMAKRGYTPGSSSYNTVINTCCKAARIDLVNKLIREMGQHGVDRDVINYNIVIHALAKAGQWQDAYADVQEALDRNHALSVTTCNATINSCAKACQWQKAVELLERMRACDVAPNMISYSAAINALAKSSKETRQTTSETKGADERFHQKSGGQWQRAAELLGRMKQEGVAPNVICYNAVLDTHAKSGQWERALGLLQDMMDDGLEPTITSFSVTIGACGRSGQSERAVDLLDVIEQHALQPNLICYNTAIDACAKVGKWQEALQLLHRMKEAAVWPDVISMNGTIDACARAGEWATAEALLRNMRSWGVAPDLISYNSAIAHTRAVANGKWRSNSCMRLV